MTTGTSLKEWLAGLSTVVKAISTIFLLGVGPLYLLHKAQVIGWAQEVAEAAIIKGLQDIKEGQRRQYDFDQKNLCLKSSTTSVCERHQRARKNYWACEDRHPRAERLEKCGTEPEEP